MGPVTGSQQESLLGRDDWAGAARIAAACRSFSPDEEDEQVADEACSCYNCRYRRWTTTSFSCCKGLSLEKKQNMVQD
jgi:hypothetical protein